ncbi:MAG: RsmE family RNA methyltransferase [Bdellovibrionales bacterium]|nr:RsmE family RNA methyltransferase [Bdellovibrionales bacterium]
MGQRHHFLCKDGLPNQATLTAKDLGPDVEQHLKALRIRSGEVVTFLDGRGQKVQAECADIKPYTFRVTDRKVTPALAPQIELCLSPPRGDALKEAVTQATEIGITALRFIRSAHSQYTSQQEAPTEKMQRVSDAATEQCARSWRCTVRADWHTLADTLRLPGIHILADEALSTQGEVIGFPQQVPNISSAAPTTIYLYIGPEGGWSDDERRLFDGRAAPLSLGALILRVPTAVVAATHFLRTVYSHSGNS